MKKFIVPVLACIALLALNGCVTTAANINSTLTKHEQSITKVITVVRREVMRRALKDPTKTDKILAQISGVAAQLHELVDQGDFDPEKVSRILKVKEPWVADALAGADFIYGLAYTEFKGNGELDLSKTLLRLLANGLAETPAAVEKDLSNQS